MWAIRVDSAALLYQKYKESCTSNTDVPKSNKELNDTIWAGLSGYVW